MPKMKMKKKLNMAAKKLIALKKKGVRKITIFYTRRVNGKMVPNYVRIALTAGIIAAAVAGAYLYRRHKKHGHVITKKKK